MNEVVLESVIEEISMGPFGSDIKVDNFISEGIPVLNGSNLTNVKLVETSFNYISEKKANSLGKANAKRGDIVVTHRGTLGQVSYIPENSIYDRYVISQSQFRVRFKDSINPIYIAYLFSTQYGQKKLLSFKNHVGVPALAQATSNFRKLEIKLHSPLEQQYIADFLKVLDDKIELNNKINAELEAMAKTLYDYWFVQFDFPDAKGKPYRMSGGKMVYNKKLKREIPEGWEVTSLYDIATFTNGLACQKFRPTGGNSLRVIKIREMKDGFSDNSELVTSDIPSSVIVNNGDLLFSWSASLDVIIWQGGIGGLNQHIFKVTSSKYDLPFIYYELSNYLIHFKRMAEARKTTMGHITIDHLKQSRIAIPPSHLIEIINNKLSSMIEAIGKKKQESQQLASLRDWLLPMLMNGQVGFKDEIQPQTKASNKQADCFQKIQSLYSIIYANNELGIQQGEMAIAKDLYLVDRIGGINTGYNFAQHNWGSFDPTEKQIINNKQYFVKKNYPNSKAIYYDLKDGGELLSKISMELKDPIKQTIQTLHQRVFSNFQRTAKAEEKELYATVLKCIEDTQSTELSQIREEMKRWKTPKQQFPDKAAKFSEQRTRVALDTIVREDWHKNVMK